MTGARFERQITGVSFRHGSQRRRRHDRRGRERLEVSDPRPAANPGPLAQDAALAACHGLTTLPTVTAAATGAFGDGGIVTDPEPGNFGPHGLARLLDREYADVFD